VLSAALAEGAIGACALGVGSASAAVRLPPADGQFDYQIGGAYPPAAGSAIVDRDRTAPPAPGIYNLCYLNALQTQPEDAAWWRANHPDLLLQSGSGGGYMTDPGWPGEMLLDTSTPAKRAALAAVEDGWIDGCKAAGYQAVDPDKLDSWTRSHGRLTAADNEAFATLLVQHAHADGLALVERWC